MVKTARSSRKKKIAAVLLIILGILVLFMWLNNANFKSNQGNYQWMAHRGVHQTFDVQTVDDSTNTASIIHKPTHDYVENTIPSIQAAFDCGATVVELDIMRTKDDQLAVFHDAKLEYRTNGNGKVSDYTMKELRKLDIGYGYTADKGGTFPFRGKGVGLMPELTEVFEAFPNKRLLIHMKDGDVKTARLLSKKLVQAGPRSDEHLYVYGDETQIAYITKHNPSYKTFSRGDLKKGLMKYELLGWTGYVPESMKNKILLLPSEYAPFLWGFPGKFLERMEGAGTIVVLSLGDGSPADGFDTEEEREKIPEGFNGLVWTNKIDLGHEE